MTPIAMLGSAREISFAAEVRSRMKLVCAWCKTTLREGDDPESTVVSHGICQSCSTVHFPERRERAERS